MDKLLKILESVNPDANFVGSDNYIEDGLLDSLDVFTLIDAIEQNYGVQLKGKDIIPENFETVNTIIALIESYRGE